MTVTGRGPESVTIVVTPADRFNVTEEALTSLYENTPQPFHLVYVDGGSPPPIRDFLRQQSQLRGFELRRTEGYLTANRARNLGRRSSSSQYIVYLENDVVVAPGWLDALVGCAEATGAAVVVPVTCENLPLHTTVHHAGGEFTPLDQIASFLAPREPGTQQRTLAVKMYHHLKPLDEVRPSLRRERTGTFERHCVLMRREVLERLDPFDEEMIATREHIDCAITILSAGEEIWFEPGAVVTYLTPKARPISRSDIEFFSLRWSDAWQQRGLEYFRRKWDLAPSVSVQYDGRRMNRRRRQAILRPIIEGLPLVGHQRTIARGIEWLLQPLERQLNKRYVARFERG